MSDEKSEEKVETKAKRFKVIFTDRAKKDFVRTYVVTAPDDPTAWQWAEKQRDSWREVFELGSEKYEDLTDPRKWKVTVQPA